MGKDIENKLKIHQMHTWKNIDKIESSIDEENVNGNDLDFKIIVSVESCVGCTLKVLISAEKAFSK